MTIYSNVPAPHCWAFANFLRRQGDRIHVTKIGDSATIIRYC